MFDDISKCNKNIKRRHEGENVTNANIIKIRNVFLSSILSEKSEGLECLYAGPSPKHFDDGSDRER